MDSEYNKIPIDRIDTEQLLREVRMEISKLEYPDAMIDFDDISIHTIVQSCESLNVSWNIPLYEEPPCAAGPGKSGKRLIKKMLRALMTFYIEPIVSKQNKFNADQVVLLHSLIRYIEFNHQKMELLEHEIECLKKQAKQPSI